MSLCPVYLNCGFGEPLSNDDLQLIKTLGYRGIRQNVKPGVTKSLVANVLNSGLYGIFIVPVDDPTACQETAHAVAEAVITLGKQNQALIEVGNEEDLAGKRWAKDPFGWSYLVRDVVMIALQHSAGSLKVVSGGISSLSKDALKWLAESQVAGLPVDIIGYHQYRSTPPSDPLKGYRSRQDEFDEFRDLVGPHSIACTETGWSTAPRESGTWPFKKRWQYTNDEALQFLQTEYAMNEREGSQLLVQYQLNNGPDPGNDQDCFGIRTVDGTLLPQSSLPRNV